MNAPAIHFIQKHSLGSLWNDGWEVEERRIQEGNVSSALGFQIIGNKLTADERPIEWEMQ
jgi:hypothetical protein